MRTRTQFGGQLTAFRAVNRRFVPPCPANDCLLTAPRAVNADPYTIRRPVNGIPCR